MDLTGARWFKSTFSSNGDAGGCVEVALLPRAVALRDSKDAALPPHHFPTADWRAFLAGVRAGDFGS